MIAELLEVHERVWLHLRFATTGFTGINGMHGFVADKYRVFHNGCLSRPLAYTYNVDSELIAADIINYSIDTALDNLREDNFANVMVVDTTNGAYHVHRTGGGSLHTDGLGNYSTYPMGTVSIPVAAGYTAYHEGAELLIDAADYMDEWDEGDIGTKDDLDRLAKANGWHLFGVPYSIAIGFDITLLTWMDELYLTTDYMENELCAI